MEYSRDLEREDVSCTNKTRGRIKMNGAEDRSCLATYLRRMHVLRSANWALSEQPTIAVMHREALVRAKRHRNQKFLLVASMSKLEVEIVKKALLPSSLHPCWNAILCGV
jgi:hypothetical protein